MADTHRITRFITTIAVLLIMALTLVPFGKHIWDIAAGVGKTSSSEKRALASWPVWPDNFHQTANYFRDVDKYINDHFGFREYYIYALNRLDAAFKHSSRNKHKLYTIVYGEDDFLFLGHKKIWDPYQGKHAFTDKDIACWVESYQNLRRAAEARDVTFMGFISPNKATIYSDKVPRSYGTISDNRLIERLYAHPDMQDGSFIDVRERLISSRSVVPTYYKTDTHWTAWGAYQAYRELMLALMQKKRRIHIFGRSKIECKNGGGAFG